MGAKFAIVVLLLFFPGIGNALTLEELRRYDQDRNEALNKAERDIYAAHRDDPILAKYDTNTNGRLDPEELRLLRADIDSRYGGGKTPPPKPVTDPKKLFAIGKEIDDAKRGGIPLEDLVQTPKALPDECKKPQAIFVRRDRMDSFLYGITARSKAQGASISYTGDQAEHVRTAKINGMVAVLPEGWRQPCLERPPGYTIDQAYLSAFAIAPWISAQGSINDPVKKSEKSALTGGFDAQWNIFGGLFNLQAFKVSPYYQTDFRGVTRSEGATASWEPWQYAVRLGGSPTLLSPNFDWYWRVQAEADARRVDKIGFTDLQVGRYAWVGGTVQVYGFFFPTSLVVPEFLQNRLNAVFTYQGYWDAYSSQSISRYAAEVAYNITADGDASISIGYERGTNKETMTWLNQYVIRLNYKY
ncbi:hypothetical protein [Bradyrhizobium sp.]|uniref:hypothetical protein n=1 Tax=Bradyrhizobium sp. TaxID=376 RepID=UPI002733DDDC|nr:hypothetical protein [Bradyrhizobium sp.]MDP3075893.1 hypothetical protein [Bradyrhizobium sp.]